ncbi:MAG: DMT family transporter [Rhodobacterales bacterium]|nr:DMT family transporter [Rhodobacterales bacterium]
MEIPAAPAAPLRAILLMVAAMAGFAVADMFIKLATEDLPPGQILLTLGLGGTAVFATLSARRGFLLLGPDLWHPAILVRMVGEALGTMGFVLALTLTTLSTVSAVLQAAPLAVTLGAGLFLGEPVGWRRWLAVVVGFVGVLIMLQPDGSGLNHGALLALLSVIGLSARDLVTRRVPARIPSLILATYGFIALVPSGLILLGISGGARWPTAATTAALCGMIAVACLSSFALTLSLRAGNIAVVAPFRYTRLIFAFGLGAVVFDDRLTPAILLGASLVAGAGIYTFYREGRLRRLARRAASIG